ncbi:MAG: hypothetical protein KatS3mg023_0215 [Armatimonadota bacterium]|nr:MAG: hypothetical protein KatS3mg023_0215 [Armatimonadota bacterium]
MKHASLLCFVLSLLFCTVGMADSPLKVPKTLVKPQLLMEPTPPEAIWLYDIAHTAPHLLLQYIDPEEYYNPNSQVYPPWATSIRRCRNYAILLLGDVGGPAFIPALLQLANRYRQGKPERFGEPGYPSDRQVAFVLELTAERIRYRMMGREAYVQEMIRWLRTPEPDSPANQPMLEYLDRVVQAARALGVIRASEAVPALLELWQTPRWHGGALVEYLVRPLARIGDKRAMPMLKLELSRTPLYGWRNALEVGELDPLLVYWLMRTDGMSLEEATWELLRSAAEESSWLRQEQIIEDYVGAVAIPYLLRALTDPPKGRNGDVAQIVIANLLGKWRIHEAVPKLRGLMRSPTASPSLRSAVARALGRIGAREALDDLLYVATYDQHFMPQLGALEALRLLGDARAEPVLLDLAGTHPDTSVRLNAFRALQTCATLSSLATLRQLWSEEKDENLKEMVEVTIREVLRRRR